MLPVTVRESAPSLRTPGDVQDLLEQAAAAVRADPFLSTAERAQAFSRLGAVALKAIEANNLVGRIAMLEAVLKQRPEVRSS